MLRSLFLYVRQKPKAVRNQIALGISSVFTGLVALIWLMGQVDQSETNLVAQNPAGTQEYERPFSGLFEQLKEQLASVRASISTTTATSSEELLVTGNEDESVTSMTLSPETIASSSPLLPTLGTPTSTATSTTGISTKSDPAPVPQPVVAEPYRVIQIATTSSTIATTTPPL